MVFPIYNPKTNRMEYGMTFRTSATQPENSDMTTNDGGPAFPVASKSTEGHQTGASGELWQFTGMTLRDWFAGMALQGYVTVAMDYDTQQGASWEDRKAAMAQHCYEFADAMLAERNK